MKKLIVLFLTAAMMLLTLGACAEAETHGNYSDEMKIDKGTVDLAPEAGADSVERDGDHADSPYFSRLDFYHMTSTDTLTILPKFQTYQQTSESSCGVVSALMVLNYYGMLGDYTEESLAMLRNEAGDYKLSGATSLKQAISIFEHVGGFQLESTYDYSDYFDEYGYVANGEIYEVISLEMIQSYLKEGIPVMVAWNDWGGHWEVVIGYDTMGTETTQDNVLIVADPYDTTDHNQDGYGVYGAERFYYNWTMYNFFEGSEFAEADLLFLAVKPL